jgi:hypothetical protein
MQNIHLMLIKRFLTAAILLISISGCTPTYDWRTVRSDDLLYEALYPGKPSRAEKIMTFQGQKITMTMEAVKVKDGLYAVGVIQVPPELRSLDSTNSLITFVQNGMLGNLKTSEVTATKLIKIKTYQGDSLTASEWVVDGIGPDQQRRLMRLRLLQRNFPDGLVQIYQQSILQTLGDDQSIEKILNSDEHSMFLSGFKPY